MASAIAAVATKSYTASSIICALTTVVSQKKIRDKQSISFAFRACVCSEDFSNKLRAYLHRPLEEFLLLDTISNPYLGTAPLQP